MTTSQRELAAPATDGSAHPTRDRVVLGVPQVILFGGMALMLVLHPNAVKSGVMSTRAIVVNGVLLGGWLLLSFVVLPRVLRNVWARSALLTAGAVAAVVVLVVPTLRDKKVVEQFPEVAIEQPARTSADAAAPQDEPPMMPVAAPEPLQIATGEIRGIDHDASGTATVYRQPDGSFVVGLENIDIEPGPDYRVYVVPTADAESPGDGTELDALKGNQGTQFYPVPREVGDVGDGWTVLVWCRAFGVPVAAATQRAI
jgi:hypothetical protein